eukprot:15294229-Alexandrium_andersonii.AAC.1
MVFHLCSWPKLTACGIIDIIDGISLVRISFALSSPLEKRRTGPPNEALDVMDAWIPRRRPAAPSLRSKAAGTRPASV